MKKLSSLAYSVFLAATLVACNFPTTTGSLAVVEKSATPTSSIPTRVPPLGTAAPVSSPQSTSVIISTAATAALPAAGPTSTQPTFSPTTTPICDRASAGNPMDISVADNSSFTPGQAFTKTWRMLNSGSCTWTTDYAVVWFSGVAFGAASMTYLAGPVPPGKSIDISVDMVAPDQSGIYQGNWKMQNKAGKLFGIGPNGDAPFWVRIVVTEPHISALDADPNPQAPTPTPKVYATGLANLTYNDGLDLDQIQINQGKADDIIYQQNANMHQIVPENGAQLVQMGKSQPSLADCQAAGLSSDPQVLDGLPAGTYFCFKTNLSLPGWARLMYLNPKDQVLTIEILAWSTP